MRRPGVAAAGTHLEGRDPASLSLVTHDVTRGRPHLQWQSPCFIFSLPFTQGGAQGLLALCSGITYSCFCTQGSLLVGSGSSSCFCAQGPLLVGSGDHIECWESNMGWPHSKQAPYLLHYHSTLPPHFIFFIVY